MHLHLNSETVWNGENFLFFSWNSWRYWINIEVIKIMSYKQQGSTNSLHSSMNPSPGKCHHLYHFYPHLTSGSHRVTLHSLEWVFLKTHTWPSPWRCYTMSLPLVYINFKTKYSPQHDPQGPAGTHSFFSASHPFLISPTFKLYQWMSTEVHTRRSDMEWVNNKIEREDRGNHSVNEFMESLEERLIEVPL